MTKGKWIVDEGVDTIENMIDCLKENQDWIAVGVADEDGYAESVAYCHPANAQAIAALPDLIEALKACMERIEKDEYSQGWKTSEEYKQAKAALRKAGQEG